jgi:hypothetical protein
LPQWVRRCGCRTSGFAPRPTTPSRPVPQVVVPQQHGRHGVTTARSVRRIFVCHSSPGGRVAGRS